MIVCTYVALLLLLLLLPLLSSPSGHSSTALRNTKTAMLM